MHFKYFQIYDSTVRDDYTLDIEIQRERRMILCRLNKNTSKHEMILKDTAMGVERFNRNTRRDHL